MTAGSWRVAIRRSRPPQCGQASTSMAKARCMSAAQLQARGLGSPTPSAAGASHRACCAAGPRPRRWVTPPLLLSTVAATPLLYLGSWLGYRLNARLPRRAFALTLVAIALAGALRLLLS